MSKQVIVIGLGQFGMALAQALAERGVEVLAVDISQEKVDAASEFAAYAVAIDAADEASLAKLLPAERDAAVCCISNTSKESGIICTALLRQMGCRYIVSRAGNATYRRILYMVGAHEVIIPEQDYGRRFATFLLYRNMIADSSSSSELNLTEIRLPGSMVGKTLGKLALPKKYGIIVAALRREGKLLRPDPEQTLKEDDMLLIVSDEQAIAKLSEELK
ncbi:MAG: TrkA family potassium uptake protein [Lentisphaeria bacterium]|nr:TrkA family potassium uptake protein [Lentisphaeria bacterium]